MPIRTGLWEMMIHGRARAAHLSMGLSLCSVLPVYSSVQSPLTLLLVGHANVVAKLGCPINSGAVGNVGPLKLIAFWDEVSFLRFHSLSCV